MVNGSPKWYRSTSRFLFSLDVEAYNLRRSMSILGVNRLTEVLKSAFGAVLRLWSGR